jgi:hypothetical protein
MFSAPRFQMSPPENAGRGRAPCLSPPPIARGGRKGARSPLGASPRHSPRLSHLDSARVRVSWNYRVQTGGPSPAPVQRAPRRPAKTRRPIGSQAARKRSVSLRPRAPLPLRRQEHPHDGVPRIFSERDERKCILKRDKSQEKVTAPRTIVAEAIIC